MVKTVNIEIVFEQDSETSRRNSGFMDILLVILLALSAEAFPPLFIFVLFVILIRKEAFFKKK